MSNRPLVESSHNPAELAAEILRQADTGEIQTLGGEREGTAAWDEMRNRLKEAVARGTSADKFSAALDFVHDLAIAFIPDYAPDEPRTEEWKKLLHDMVMSDKENWIKILDDISSFIEKTQEYNDLNQNRFDYVAKLRNILTRLQ